METYLNQTGLARYVSDANAYMASVADANAGGAPYGICSTPAAEAAKTVSIPGYKLGLGDVCVQFTSAINAANPTLDVTNTGAKPIYYNGASLTPGVVRPNCTVLMYYDGSRFNVLKISGLEIAAAPADLYVDMGLSSGLMWATRNIDLTQANGFATDPYQYECSYFSWGNLIGYNPSGTSFRNIYSWTQDAYNETVGSRLLDNISRQADAARANLRSPWRLPSMAEFLELYNACTYEFTTVSGVTGLLFTSRANGNTLFLPCCGDGESTMVMGQGSSGYYPTSSWYSGTSCFVFNFLAGSSPSVTPQTSNPRRYGHVIRPVF